MSFWFLLFVVRLNRQAFCSFVHPKSFRAFKSDNSFPLIVKSETMFTAKKTSVKRAGNFFFSSFKKEANNNNNHHHNARNPLHFFLSLVTALYFFLHFLIYLPATHFSRPSCLLSFFLSSSKWVSWCQCLLVAAVMNHSYCQHTVRDYHHSSLIHLCEGNYQHIILICPQIAAHEGRRRELYDWG